MTSETYFNFLPDSLTFKVVVDLYPHPKDGMVRYLCEDPDNVPPTNASYAICIRGAWVHRRGVSVEALRQPLQDYLKSRQAAYREVPYLNNEPPLDPNLTLRVKRIHAESTFEELKRYIKPEFDYRLCFLKEESATKAGLYTYAYSYHDRWWKFTICMPRDGDLSTFNGWLSDAIDNVHKNVHKMEEYFRKDAEMARLLDEPKPVEVVDDFELTQVNVIVARSTFTIGDCTRDRITMVVGD